MDLLKVNLGSGKFPKAGYVNLDILPADVQHDLNSLPYPFDDNTIDLIEADHLLEHLHEPFQVMRELHRILKPGGRAIIRVPHFSRGFTHSDHKRGFDVGFPLYFNPDMDDFVGAAFQLDAMRLKWSAQPYRAKKLLSPFQYAVARTLDVVFTFVANLSPYACSRLWCFWVGGFEEIAFTFRKL
jgi:SAM-dependent methyltransferase